MSDLLKKAYEELAAKWWEELGPILARQAERDKNRVYDAEFSKTSIDRADLTRLRTIERAALALLVNRKDLGLIGCREALMGDLATAFGPIDPKQHKVKYP